MWCADLGQRGDWKYQDGDWDRHGTWLRWYGDMGCDPGRLWTWWIGDWEYSKGDRLELTWWDGWSTRDNDDYDDDNDDDKDDDYVDDGDDGHGDDDDDDDDDDVDLGGHGEKCGHPERNSRRDGVLVKPETHLIRGQFSCNTWKGI